ncbi:oxidoreductase [Streptomyces sp. NBC_01381]|uniref:NADH-quinone oxidoreductase subunit B family protein n=1 Tax=Streptomyces sp. NBC_01381 TaxID=2903845 RepID=UPI002251710B|nr:oxidoreductase [Streptomyces sp. NBC_01381]MCX4673720.1 oxidoreductase [Streptomyces sp. NBC_01381]
MGLPTLAVFKLASCDGCQLTLLDCEDELLGLAGQVEIAHFLEASSAVRPGPYDLTLVEGSVTTPADAERIHAIRAASRHLVTIGACATAGGIQALRNFADVDEFTRTVYARPDYIDTLATSTPASAHVDVDFELRGCPIDRRQLLEVITAYLAGPLGPVTHAGCGAICPAYGRGCFGPSGSVNLPALIPVLHRDGMDDRDTERFLHTFNTAAFEEELRR